MRGIPIFTRHGSRPAPLAIFAMAMAMFSVGCASQDPAGIRIAVDAGGKGTMTIAALTAPAVATVQPTASKGVKWTDGVQLTITAGDFGSIDDVSFEDLIVDAADFTADSGTVRIVIPRGDDARWYRALHVSAKQRAAMQKALERAIQKVELNENLTIAVEMTGAEVAANPAVAPVLLAAGIDLRGDLLLRHAVRALERPVHLEPARLRGQQDLGLRGALGGGCMRGYAGAG